MTVYGLIDKCFTARQYKIGQFVPLCQGGEPAPVVEDRKQNALHNNSHMRTMNINMQQLTTGMYCECWALHTTDYTTQNGLTNGMQII